jgi:hypothetical protein
MSIVEMGNIDCYIAACRSLFLIIAYLCPMYMSGLRSICYTRILFDHISNQV